jgi:O-antigen ligase
MYLPQKSTLAPVALTLIGALGVALVAALFTALGAGHYATAMVVVVVVLAALVRDYRAGVVALMIFYPLAGTTIVPREMFGISGMNPMNIVMFGTVVACLMSRNRRDPKQQHMTMDPKILWMYVLPIALAGLYGSVHLGDINANFREIEELTGFDSPREYLMYYVLRPLLYVAYAWTVSIAVRESKEPEKFLWAFAISALIMCLVVLYGIAITGASLADLASPRARKTVGWTGLHNNDIGPMFVYALGILLFSAARQRPGLKMFMLSVAVLCGLAAMMSFSRNAFIGIAVVVLGYFVGGKLSWRLAGGVAFLLLAVLFLPREFIGRANTGVGSGSVLNASDDKLSAGRVAGVWIPAMKDIMLSPVYGHGLEGTLWNKASFNDDSGDAFEHPHNAYLRSLMDMGVVGSGLVLAFLFYVGKLARRLASQRSLLRPTERSMAQGAFWALVLLFIQGLTGGAFHPIVSQVFAWGAFGILFGLRARATDAEWKQAAVAPPKGA